MASGPIVRSPSPIVSPGGATPSGGQSDYPGGGSGKAGGIYISGNENLLLTTINTAASVVLSVGVRFVNEKGEPVPVVRLFTLNSAGTPQSQVIRLAGGKGYWIDGIFIIPSSGTPGPTDTYVEVGVVLGDAATRTLQTKLIVSGFTTADVAVSFPVGSSFSTQRIIGQGTYAQNTVSGSLAGGLNLLSITTGLRVHVRQCYIAISTGAGVGNRFLNIQMNNSGGSITFRRICKCPQPASTTYLYILGDVEDDTALIARAVNLVNMNISNFIVPEGFYNPTNIAITLDGVLAGDAVVAPGATITYEYWQP